MKKYFIIILILGIFGGMIFMPKKFSRNEAVIFQIEKGESLREISVNLEKEGLIWWNPFFRIYSFLRGRDNNLQAGCYRFSSAMNIPKISAIFASGLIAKEKITIPEGFTSEQIQQVLKNVTQLDSATLAEHEGYLFPDTYEIPYCMEQEKVVEIMTENFSKKTIGFKITPEAVVMASLLEKELITKEDKKIASGILWKRLRVGMPLQVDVYLWTYENYGLPEKPISNPGLESIEAALNPKESPYFYYLSTSDGRTIFSRTLDEHNIARAKYLTGK